MRGFQCETFKNWGFYLRRRRNIRKKCFGFCLKWIWRITMRIPNWRELLFVEWGCNHISNHFTCIGPQGISVVDYCIIPHEDLDKYLDFNVQTVSDLINELHVIDSTAALATKPHNSVLSWKMKTTTSSRPSCYKWDKRWSQVQLYIIWKEYTRILFTGWNTTARSIWAIENNLNNQSATDNTDTKFVEILKREMHDKLNPKVISVSYGQNNKNRKTKKPWWSNELSEIWNILCVKEKRHG